LKFAHIIVCGLAAVAFPVAVSAKENTHPAAHAATGAAASATTLFPGSLDIPIIAGSSVPATCNFPDSLRAATDYDLACVQASPDDGADVQYISWLGEHGWRHAADIEGGIVAVSTESNGCERELNIYLHGEDSADSGIWFALKREPTCTEAR
jgi:hypothetical protein